MKTHYSVLLKEAINSLNLNSNGIYVDATLGRGGHSAAILQKISNGSGMLYAFDQDEQAIKESEKNLQVIGQNYKLIHSNFVNLTFMLALNNVHKVDGILFDLGVSSPQFDQDFRGFSYRFDGPLDMRMDLQQELTAYKVVNDYSQKQLSDIFIKYGEEKFASRIANFIVQARIKQPIASTFALVDVIKAALPQKILKQPKHPAKKVFQALRIYVNNELEVLRNAITQAGKLLNKHGRLVIITFHSLEENIVKQYFKSQTTSEIDSVAKALPIEINVKHPFTQITKRPIQPGTIELEQNRRSHSAKLWVLERN